MVQVLIMEVVSDREHAYVRKLYQDFAVLSFCGKILVHLRGFPCCERRRVPRH